MGSEDFYPEERPVHRVEVDGFWMDEAPVTAGEYRRFVRETGYVTVAERSVDPELREARKQAVACLEEGLRLAPAHRATYQTLLDAYRTWKQPEQATAVARRLVGQFPDDFEAWLDAEATDGFALIQPRLIHGLRDVVEHIIPELKRRGIYRGEYGADTLRGNLGVRRPENIHVASRAQATAAE